jgi:hypothetical protein
MTTTASAMPYTNLGEALATDYLFVREQFSTAEWDRFLQTREDRGVRAHRADARIRLRVAGHVSPSRR